MFRQAGIIRAPTLADLYQWGWALATQPIPAGRNIAILTHSGGPATSMADAATRVGLNLPRFEGELLERVRKLIPKTGSAANPIDLTFSMDPKLLAETLPELLLSSDEIDGLLIHGIQGSSFFEDLKEVAGELLHLEVEQVISLTEHVLQPLLGMSQRFGKPILTSSFFDRRDNLVRLLQDNFVPVFDMPERSVSAMAALVRYADIRKRNGC
jgi:acetyltransferase